MRIKFNSSVSCGTQILPDILVRVLQVLLHLSTLMINGQQLSSTEFKSKSADLVSHCSLFNDIDLVVKDPLKRNNPIIFF